MEIRRKGNAVAVPAPVGDSELASAGKAEAQGWDLLSLGPVRRIMASPFYPGILQGVSVAVFALVVYYGFFGTIRPAYNFATAVTWTLWWPLLPLSLLLAGRVWCAVCPLVPAISLTQRLVRPGRTPGRLLRSYGVWFMGLTFVLITWADRVWSITSSPKATALLLLSLLLLAVAAAAVYRRRVFCRHLCPIGALTGLYSMTSVVELRSKSPADCEGCAQECIRGSDLATGCPLSQYVRTMDSNRNCNLCGQCVKSCAKGVVELRLRPLARELWQLRNPVPAEALLAVLLVGMVSVQTVDMTTAWGAYMRWLLETTPLNSYNVGFTFTFVAVLMAAVGVYLLVTRWSADRGSWRRNFAAFGYAYIPLALAVHLGHNSMHLLGEGAGALRVALGTTIVPGGGGTQQLNLAWMVPLVVLGGLGSLYAARRISLGQKTRGVEARLYPHLVLLVVLTGLFIQLFLLPMNFRHAH